METTDFEDVLREACAEVALDPENLSAQDFRAFRRSAKRRLEMAWEYHFWPVLGRMEQRWFRPDWNAGTTYGAASLGVDNSANEVFYPPTQLYYQSLVAGNVNNAPADASGNTDNAHWAVSYVGAYTAIYLPNSTILPTTTAQSYNSTVTYVQGNQVTYAGQYYQLYVTTATGVLPTDTSKWGLLTSFDAYVAYEQTGKTAIGVVGAAYSANPRVTTRGVEVSWNLSERGIQVRAPLAYVWTDYRIRCPKLSGDIWVGDKIYTVGQQIYYSSAATPGNFYTCATTTAAGESPESAADKWAVVEIPRIFHKYLVLGMAADAPGNDPQTMGTLIALAGGALDDQKSLLVGQQSQRIKTVVETR